jgi:class 3 adenylate cyclase
MLAGVSVLAILGITLVIGRLRQTSKELEHRVIERTAQLQETNIQLSNEQEKSERLLLNILPQVIAEQLKEKPSHIADGFAEVTILFADIVGFTQLSERLSPTQVVNLLNEIFSAFDRLTEEYGLEKIKTIGDAYMVVGGIPMPRSDHAEAIAAMALDMRKEVARFNLNHSTAINIRIGINTGPVVAGVIGTKKFIYDLWGDAVNTASRMESHGLAGCIQITQSTYERLKDGYLIQERGRIPIKGKGEMTTYLLIGEKTANVLV